MTWVIREGTARKLGGYWSPTEYYVGGAWRPSLGQAFRYDSYRRACVVLGNLSAEQDARIVQIKPAKRVRVDRSDLMRIISDLLAVADMQRITGAGVSVARRLRETLLASTERGE